MKKSTVINLVLLAAAALVIVGAWFMGNMASAGREERFGGSDSAATAAIEQDHPDVTPWATPWFEPGSAEIESGLFALQAALGAGVVGYALGVMRTRRALRHPQRQHTPHGQ